MCPYVRMMALIFQEVYPTVLSNSTTLVYCVITLNEIPETFNNEVIGR